MGRGLSDLQKRILVLALQGMENYGQEKIHLYNKEVMADAYDLPMLRPTHEIWQDMSNRDLIRRDPGSRHFYVMIKRHNSATTQQVRPLAERYFDLGSVV